MIVFLLSRIALYKYVMLCYVMSPYRGSSSVINNIILYPFRLC